MLPDFLSRLFFCGGVVARAPAAAPGRALRKNNQIPEIFFRFRFRKSTERKSEILFFFFCFACMCFCEDGRRRCQKGVLVFFVVPKKAPGLCRLRDPYQSRHSLNALPSISEPKGPFRTKNTTAPESVVLCDRRSFFLVFTPLCCFIFF